SLCRYQHGRICRARHKSHCRRRFYELAVGGKAPVAATALTRIAKFYEIEAEIRGTSAEARQLVRQVRTRPLLEAFKTWLDGQALAASRGSPLADALNYALNHWEGLTRFLLDGRIEIDSNTVERAIKPLTITRSFCPCRAGSRHPLSLACALSAACSRTGVPPTRLWPACRRRGCARCGHRGGGVDARPGRLRGHGPRAATRSRFGAG
ncbi:MAG: transposase, partial [Alphaproteobacteria bacterium]|nr:transposase [Alphaproteobacteria bacterium]